MDIASLFIDIPELTLKNQNIVVNNTNQTISFDLKNNTFNQNAIAQANLIQLQNLVHQFNGHPDIKNIYYWPNQYILCNVTLRNFISNKLSVYVDIPQKDFMRNKHIGVVPSLISKIMKKNIDSFNNGKIQYIISVKVTKQYYCNARVVFSYKSSYKRENTELIDRMKLILME